MVVIGCLLVLLASVLHSWYASNATAANRAEVAVGFVMHGAKVLVASILILVAGLVFIWVGSGFLVAAFATVVYFLVISPLSMFLLGVLKWVPEHDKNYQERARVDREYASLTADSPEEQLLRMRLVGAIQSSYFRSKQADPDKPDVHHLYSALKACCPDKLESQVKDLAGRCTSIEDTIIEAVRLNQGNDLAEKLKLAIYSRPICPDCRIRRALKGSICEVCFLSARAAAQKARHKDES